MDFLNWFSGGERQYHTLYNCMMKDTAWIAITVALDVIVATGYGIIAYHWWKQQRGAGASPAAESLKNLRNIFVFCGICGYVFIPIKIFWPAWRLYDIVMVFLAYSTWRFALNAKSLKVVYNELGKTRQLAIDLENSRKDSKRKNFFLNAVSHDLRTPLNSLVLQAEVAEVGVQTGDSELLKQSLADIKASARVAAQLLDNFLELGRLDWAMESTELVDVHLDELLDGVVHRHRAEADRKNLELIYNQRCEVRMRVDRIKLERILDNLIQNALKFTDKGRVTVSVEVMPGLVNLHVQDTGQGIAGEHLNRLFDEFYQVTNEERNRTKGFGLGLAIVRRLAQQLGGQIHVATELGRGSKFSLSIPRTSAHATADGASVDSALVPATAGR